MTESLDAKLERLRQRIAGQPKGLTWQAATSADWHQTSACGRFSVCKIVLRSGAMYEAWRTRQHEDGPHLIATNLPTSQAAREAAEGDAND